jgi:2'-5' RNA ligase
MRMRLFIGTRLSPDVRAAYEAAMAALIDQSRGLLRPIPQDSAHMTHAFLPSVGDDALAPLLQAMDAVARAHHAHDVRFGVPVVLTGGREARLICAPVTDGAAAVKALAEDVVLAARHTLAGVEVRASKSLHVTLARFRKGTDRRAAAAVERHLKEDALTQRDRITHIAIVSSRLSPSGPRYTVLGEAPLGQ